MLGPNNNSLLVGGSDNPDFLLNPNAVNLSYNLLTPEFINQQLMNGNIVPDQVVPDQVVPDQVSPNATEEIIQDDVANNIMNNYAVDQEQFVSKAFTELGEPSTAFPMMEGQSVTEDVTPFRRKLQTTDDVKSVLGGFLDGFSDRSALGKIGLGIALLEGVPINDAFSMYSEFTQGDLAEVELFDKTTGQVVDVGPADSRRLQELLKSNPARYELLPIGTMSARKSGIQELMLSAQIQASNNLLVKKFGAPESDLVPKLEKMKEILESGYFKSGGFTPQLVALKKKFGLEDDLTDDQIVFQALSSYIVPRLRAVGSGSTSDFEATLFERAAPSLDKTVEANLEIVDDMLLAYRLQETKSLFVTKGLETNPSIADIESEFNRIIDKLYNRDGSVESYLNIKLTDKEKKVMQDVFGGVPLPKSYRFRTDIIDKLDDNTNYEFVL
jgi:hypothetical protein